uniref:NS7a protein n=2 Tax=Rousettus bat coronavirus TaxID=1892416 RepID=A0A1B3IZF4_9BETC|nr:NS7a protein [Rousettus bat coronavirus]
MKPVLLLLCLLAAAQAITLSFKVLSVCDGTSCHKHTLISCPQGDVVNITQAERPFTVVACVTFTHVLFSDVGKSFQLTFNDQLCGLEQVEFYDTVSVRGQHVIRFGFTSVCFDNGIVGGCQTYHLACPQHQSILHLREGDLYWQEACIHTSGFTLADVGKRYEFSLRHRNCLRHVIKPHSFTEDDSS